MEYFPLLHVLHEQQRPLVQSIIPVQVLLRHVLLLPDRIVQKYAFKTKISIRKIDVDPSIIKVLQILKLADLPVELTPHSLRHTPTSLLLAQAGVNLVLIMWRSWT